MKFLDNVGVYCTESEKLMTNNFIGEMNNNKWNHLSKETSLKSERSEKESKNELSYDRSYEK